MPLSYERCREYQLRYAAEHKEKRKENVRKWRAAKKADAFATTQVPFDPTLHPQVNEDYETEMAKKLKALEKESKRDWWV